MKIAVIQTNTILSSWTALAIPQELRLMGHDVIQGLVPVNEFGQVRTGPTTPLEYKRLMAGFPRFEQLQSCDMVMCVAPEYYLAYIQQLYPNWHTLPTRVGMFAESSKRSIFDYDKVRPYFTHVTVPDPNDKGFYVKPSVDTRKFCPDANVPKTWDVGFIGTLYEKRVDFLNKLLPLIPDVDFRYGTINMRDLDGERQEDWADAMVNNIRRLKIHVNLPSNNPMTCARPLETMACGTLCITYRPNDDLFKDGEHLIYYDSPQQCADVINRLFKFPRAIETMAETGMHYTRHNFSLKSRLEEVLTHVVS